MASVVFLRGVNVGGHKAFSPSALAKELAELDVVNVGAAGTFVVRKRLGKTALREEIVRRLPVQAELMICGGRELLELAAGKHFAAEPANPDVKRYVSMLAKAPKKLPAFPITQPDGNAWQVKIIDVVGCFALSLHRRMGPRLIYPNEVVEKRLGVSATTRNWNTIEAICEILNDA